MSILLIEFFKILLTSGLIFTLYRARKTFQKARVLLRSRSKTSN